MPPAAFFSLRTEAADPRTLTVLLEYVHKTRDMVLDTQQHTITMDPARGAVTITSTSRNGVTASEEVFPSYNTIVLVDFLPHVFENTVKPMYAISADRVAVLINPFAAGIKGCERPLIRFEDSMFEDVFGGRIRVEPQSDSRNMSANYGSGMSFLEDALATLFDHGMAVKWGTQQILRP